MADHLDHIFRKKLRDRHFSPEAGDWMAMEKKLNTNPIAKKGSNSGPRLFYIFLASIVIVGIVASISYPSAETEKEVKTELFKTNNDTPLTIDDKTEAANTPSSKLNSTSKNKASSINNDKSVAPLKKEIVKENDALQIVEKENKKVEKVSLKTENTSVLIKETENYESKLEKTSKSSIVLEDIPVENIDQSEEQSLAISALSSPNRSFNSKTEILESNDQMQMTSSISDLSTVKSLDYSAGAKDDFKKDFSSYQLSSISIHTFEDKTTQQNVIGLSNDFSDAQRIKSLMPKRKLPIQLSIAAFGEVAYVMKKITGDSEFASLIRSRNDEEKNIFSVGGGIEVQAKYKQWSLSTGFSSTSWGENIQYEEKYNSDWEVTSSVNADTSWTEEIVFTYDTVYNPVDSTIYIYIDSSLVTVIDSIYFTTVYDSTEVISDLGISDHNGKSTISYWEIPLYFSYQFDVGDFYLTPGLGITIGFLKITRGHYLAKDQASLIEINSDYAVVRKTLLNGQINMGVGYRLGDRLSIEATPAFRFNLSNIFEDTGIIQKYKSVSLQFRLRYYF